MITRLFPSQCNVYSKGPVGDNCFHIALLLNTPSTLAIAKYLVKLYGKTLVNTPYQVRSVSAAVLLAADLGWDQQVDGGCMRLAAVCGSWLPGISR